jgi:hypothetical protein
MQRQTTKKTIPDPVERVCFTVKRSLLGTLHQPSNPHFLMRVARCEGDTQMRPKIGAAIVEQFGDGKWHSRATIAKVLDTTEDHVATTLETMRKMQTYGARSERKRVGTSCSYRIFRKKNMISSNELVEKLGPIIKSLKAEGKKNAATMSPGTVAHLAAQLRNLLDEWTAASVGMRLHIPRGELQLWCSDC